MAVMDDASRKPICYCYVDTNTFLHYRLFTDVDWREILNAENVVLVVCPAVISALDRIKMDPETRVRDRARAVIAKLSELGKAGQLCEIKPGIELLLLPKEPMIDWSAQGLSPDVPDDRMVATILSERKGQEHVILVTADLGLNIKAELRAIDCVKVPDSLLASSAKTPLELENQKLKQKLAKFETRIPKPKLLFLSKGENADFAKFTLRRVAPLSEPEIEAEVGRLRAELDYEPIPKPPHILGSFARGLSKPLDGEVERYKEEVEAYLKRVPEHLLSRRAYKERLSRIIKLKFVLYNYGSEPAEDIDIFLHLPDGLSVYGKKDFPKPPKNPEKPSGPKSVFDVFQDRPFHIPDMSVFSPGVHNVGRDYISTGPFIKKRNSYEVRYSVPKLKHGLEIHLDPVFIEFPSIDEVRSVHINYSIFAGNIPEETEGKLHIITEVPKP